MRRRTKCHTSAQWSPRRLRLLLLSGTALSVLALVILVWTVVQVLVSGGTETDGSDPDPATVGVQGSDVQPDVSAARPGPLTTVATGRIRLPAATEVGPAGVPTGFPNTPEGALAQLAAIDQTALASASLPDAQFVAEEWIAPGGPSPEQWSVVSAVSELLTTSGQPGEGTSVLVAVEPTMGAFRNGDTLDATPADGHAVTPCIDFVVSLTTSATDQIAAADCQRMIWTGNRWMIAAGAEEQPPESIWPGSAESVEAGWRWLVIP